jgi:hypothetical protein
VFVCDPLSSPALSSHGSSTSVLEYAETYLNFIEGSNNIYKSFDHASEKHNKKENKKEKRKPKVTLSQRDSP